MKTRAWESETGSTTVIQFRTDTTPMVWMHTNIGWIAVSNAPTDPNQAEAFAQEIAEGYELIESSQSRALYLAGVEDFDEKEWEAEVSIEAQCRALDDPNNLLHISYDEWLDKQGKEEPDFPKHWTH